MVIGNSRWKRSCEDPSADMTQDAFGPNLRRIRLQRGITLKQLAEATKVPEDLWAALERNDVSRWPAGIFARAYVRQYALAIGVDPDSTVDEFCRWFPQGDRRGAEPSSPASFRETHSPLAALFVRVRRTFGKA